LKTAPVGRQYGSVLFEKKVKFLAHVFGAKQTKNCDKNGIVQSFKF